MSTVGGAAGPLYGTAYLRAAKATGVPELDSQGVVALLEGALEGIIARGKAHTGEKTMVDAWTPAVEAAVAAADSGATPAAVLQAAATAAGEGAEATVEMIATKGRAGYLGERSAHHMDPGARSTADPARRCPGRRVSTPQTAARARTGRTRARLALPRAGRGGCRGSAGAAPGVVIVPAGGMDDGALGTRTTRSRRHCPPRRRTAGRRSS